MELPPHIDTARALYVHSVARDLVPAVSTINEHLVADPSHVIIAVERHDKDSPRWRYALPKDRFLWIKAKLVSCHPLIPIPHVPLVTDA